MSQNKHGIHLLKKYFFLIDLRLHPNNFYLLKGELVAYYK
jgi:hypothetical protein